MQNPILVHITDLKYSSDFNFQEFVNFCWQVAK